MLALGTGRFGGLGSDHAQWTGNDRCPYIGGLHGAGRTRTFLRQVRWLIISSKIARRAAVAMTTGLVCGALATGTGGPISPPYAAIIDTLAGYPALLRSWRRVRRAGRRSASMRSSGS